MSSYEFWLDRDGGTRLRLLDSVVSFEYALVVHDVSVLTLTLPGSFDKALLEPDRRIEVWRAPEGGSLQLERVFLLRRRLDKTDEHGKRTIAVTAYDGNYLLSGRIAAYAAGAAQVYATQEADELMRVALGWNLDSVYAPAARAISSSYFTMPLLSTYVGPVLTKGWAWRNVLPVLQEIAQAADEAGTPIYWDMVPVSATAWEFRTRSGQPGYDHSYPDGQHPVLLGLEYGNLAEPALDEDWTNEVTYVYGAGQGEGAARTISGVEDTARSGRSLFGRREALADARNESTTAGVTAAANARLREGRPRRTFSAKIVDSPGTRYGLHWRWGDKVSACYDGQQFDCIVRVVRVALDGNGKETVEARLEVQE